MALALLLTGGALAGCGVPPTGVLDGGEGASGLTRGLRLYFVADGGLRGVPRPGQELADLPGALKLLAVGPTEAERRAGLTTLDPVTSYKVTGSGARVTVRTPDAVFTPDPGDLRAGQLVCTLARAQSLLTPGIRPDQVRVTLDGEGPATPPLGCAPYLAHRR